MKRNESCRRPVLSWADWKPGCARLQPMPQITRHEVCALQSNRTHREIASQTETEEVLMNNARKSRFLLTTAVLLAGVSLASAQGMREGGGGGAGGGMGAGGGAGGG